MKMEERKGKRKAEKQLEGEELLLDEEHERKEKEKVMRKFKQHKPVDNIF